MSRMLRCKAWMTLFGAAAMGVGSAQGHQMLYDQDGYRLAVGYDGPTGRVEVWDAAERRALATLEGHARRVEAMAFHPGAARCTM